jgi:hypothetical protein
VSFCVDDCLRFQNSTHFQIFTTLVLFTWVAFLNTWSFLSTFAVPCWKPMLAMSLVRVAHQINLVTVHVQYKIKHMGERGYERFLQVTGNQWYDFLALTLLSFITILVLIMGFPQVWLTLELLQLVTHCVLDQWYISRPFPRSLQSCLRTWDVHPVHEKPSIKGWKVSYTRQDLTFCWQRARLCRLWRT